MTAAEQVRFINYLLLLLWHNNSRMDFGLANHVPLSIDSCLQLFLVRNQVYPEQCLSIISLILPMVLSYMVFLSKLFELFGLLYLFACGLVTSILWSLQGLLCLGLCIKSSTPYSSLFATLHFPESAQQPSSIF